MMGGSGLGKDLWTNSGKMCLQGRENFHVLQMRKTQSRMRIFRVDKRSIAGDNIIQLLSRIINTCGDVHY